DDFIEEATEVDVDAICDGTHVYVAAIMRHVELAGVHSGDSACAIPPVGIEDSMQALIEEQTKKLALELEVRGLINIQFAVRGDELFILEVNPRASRTVPFVSKAKGIPLAKIALKVMLGHNLSDFNLSDRTEIPYVCVKEAVLPFGKFPGVDTILSPEMKSTGEVMGIADTFNEAYYKASLAAGDRFPLSGRVCVSLTEHTRKGLLEDIKKLADGGYTITATSGTAQYLRSHGIACEIVYKVNEGRPDILDQVKNKEIDVILNTPTTVRSKKDSHSIRQVAVRYKIPIVTTVPGIRAAIEGMLHMKTSAGGTVRPIQEYHSLRIL
ncbi:MAG: ATP-grasp domain-containing protein, partial [Spirochaetota bacterium]